MNLEEFIKGSGVASEDKSQVFAGKGLIEQFNLQKSSGVTMPIVAYLKPKNMLIGGKETSWYEIYYILLSQDGTIVREGKDSTFRSYYDYKASCNIEDR